MNTTVKVKFKNLNTGIVSKAYTIDELVNGKFKENGNVEDLIKLEYTKINDRNNQEIYNADKIKIKFKEVDNIAIVELFRGTFCLNFIEGNIVDINLEKEERYIPLSYINDAVSDDIQIINE